MDQSNNSVAIGDFAGYTRQGYNSIAIGYQSGYTGQGNYSIAIGHKAGYTDQSNNSIILNATNSTLDASGGLFVKPIRNNTINGNGEYLKYNSNTGEIYSDIIDISALDISATDLNDSNVYINNNSKKYRIVAVGQNQNFIIYSDDNGLTWKNNTNASNVISNCIGVAYSGSLWVAVGAGIANPMKNSIIYSSDGINWNGASTQGVHLFWRAGVGIAYGGSLWVAVGTRWNRLYSSDGMTWNQATDFSPNIPITSISIRVTYNGLRWIASYNDSIYNFYISDNGKNTWKGVTTGVFNTAAQTIYTGSRWVAVGQGNYSIAYSDDNGENGQVYQILLQ